MARTSHRRHDLLLLLSNMVCWAWCTLQLDKVGKHMHLFLSAQSITALSCAISDNRATMRSKTACRVSPCICRWISLAWTDSLLIFGGTGSKASSIISIFVGMFHVQERLLPIVIYTGHTFLSAVKFVK